MGAAISPAIPNTASMTSIVIRNSHAHTRMGPPVKRFHKVFVVMDEDQTGQRRQRYQERLAEADDEYDGIEDEVAEYGKEGDDKGE